MIGRLNCRSFFCLLCNNINLSSICPYSALNLPYEKFRNTKRNVTQRITEVIYLPLFCPYSALNLP